MKSLASMPWPTVVIIAFYALMFSALSRLFLEPDTRHWVKAATLTGIGLLVAARYAAGFDGGWRRMRAARDAGLGWTHSLLALQPPEFFGLQQYVARLLIGFARWLARRPAPSMPVGEVFTMLRRSSYPALAAVLGLCAVVELPVGALILRAVGISPELQHVLHGVFVVGMVATLVLGLGDLYWLRAGRHVVDADALHLRLGERVTARVPFTAIHQVEPIEKRRSTPRRVSLAERRRVLKVSPLESPNVRLHVRSGAWTGRVRGAPVSPSVEVIELYVDDPETLIAALSRATPIG